MASRQRELAKNTIILTFGKICTQFVGFLLLPLYTTLLTPKEYGIVDLFNTYILLLVPIFNWQFENGLFRFLLDCRDDKEKQTKVFSTVMISNLIQVALYMVFYLLVQKFITSEYKIFLAIDVITNIFLNTLLQFPRGIGRNKSYAIASFLSASLSVIMNVIFIAGFKMGPSGIFLAIVLSKTITIIYVVLTEKIWRFFSAKSFDKHLFKKISQYSFPLIPNSIAWWVVGASDRTVVSFFLGISANGLYSVANKFSSIFATFYNIFNMSWTESATLHIDDEDGKDFLIETINSMFGLFSAVCLGIIAVMPFVFPLMINSQYADAYYQIPILMLAVLCQVIVGLYSVIYIARKRSVEIAKTSIYAAVINVVVDVLLIRYIGLYAASISTLVAYAVMAIYRHFDVRKYIDIHIDNKLIIETFVVSIIMLFMYYYNHFLSNLLALIFVIIYAILINKEFLVSILIMIKEKINNLK